VRLGWVDLTVERRPAVGRAAGIAAALSHPRRIKHLPARKCGMKPQHRECIIGISSVSTINSLDLLNGLWHEKTIGHVVYKT
jgi:hypothetical protein